ncbi:hypothetical protein [Falsibacillus pallidus]|uniref:Uncharacterized protein n=1 Tax=Falsibacillus pallidus TaxID=493781 RepID=A0A370GMJ1_9BACI|nr:hypothetical protein [Falsibacillus pallidus]RDI43123.1 hypothetical protein DFR59_104174 [Falsibacillus pallidus]
MNIKDYFRKQTALYLYQVVLYSLMAAFVFLIDYHFHIPGTIFLILIVILNAVLFGSVIKYIYYASRLSSTKPFPMDETAAARIQEDVGDRREYLLIKDPSPGFSLKFFSYMGLCEFEIKDNFPGWWNWLTPASFKEWKTNSFIVKKRDGQAVGEIKLNPNTYRLSVVFGENSFSLKYLRNNRKAAVFECGNDVVEIQKQGNGQSFVINNRKVAELSKGYMPLSIQKLFPVNTPILSFNEKTSEKEQWLVVSLLICLWFNRDR